jgi:mannosyltransferase
VLSEQLAAGREDRVRPVRSRLRPLLVPALQTAVAATTTLLLLGRKSFWVDEGYSFVAAHQSFGDLLRLVVHDESNMSPYYLALHFWTSLGGSEAWIRLLSALPAIAAVPLFALLMRHLADARTGVIAGFGLAVNPMQVQYAQEARAYSLLVLCVVTSSLLFVRAVLRPGAPGLLVAWAAISAVTGYVHYFGLLVTCAQLASLALLPDMGAAVRRFLPAAAAVLVLEAPIAVFVARRPGDPLSWVPALSARDLPALLAHFAGSIPLAVAAVVPLAAAASLAVGTLREQGRSPAAWRHGMLWLWLTLPPLVTAVVSLAHPVWVARYLIVSLPAFVGLAAIGLVRLRRPLNVATAALLAVLTLTALVSYYLSSAKNGEDWRSASRYVYGRLQPHDAIWFAPGPGRAPFTYYSWAQDRPPVADLTLAPGGQDGRIHAREIPRTAVRARLLDHVRIWVVRRHEQGGADEPATTRRLAELTRQGFHEVEAGAFGAAVEVQLWSRDSARPAASRP